MIGRYNMHGIILAGVNNDSKQKYPNKKLIVINSDKYEKLQKFYGNKVKWEFRKEEENKFDANLFVKMFKKLLWDSRKIPTLRDVCSLCKISMRSFIFNLKNKDYFYDKFNLTSEINKMRLETLIDNIKKFKGRTQKEFYKFFSQSKRLLLNLNISWLSLKRRYL